MIIRVYEMYLMDLIEVPDYVAHNIQVHLNKFYDWLPSSPYRSNKGYEYDIHAIVEYLNDTVLEDKEEKAIVIKEGFTPTKEEKEKLKKYPKIYL